MKCLKTFSVFFTLSILYLQSPAQNTAVPVNEPDYNKPQLFADLPDKMPLDVTAIESLFSLRTGSSTRVQPSIDVLFIGDIISSSDVQGAKTMVIKLINRPGATFTFTKITAKDGTVSYRGRIISRNNSDAFEVVKDKDQYFLVKKNLYDLMNE